MQHRSTADLRHQACAMGHASCYLYDGPYLITCAPSVLQRRKYAAYSTCATPCEYVCTRTVQSTHYSSLHSRPRPRVRVACVCVCVRHGNLRAHVCLYLRVHVRVCVRVHTHVRVPQVWACLCVCIDACVLVCLYRGEAAGWARFHFGVGTQLQM